MDIYILSKLFAALHLSLKCTESYFSFCKLVHFLKQFFLVSRQAACNSYVSCVTQPFCYIGLLMRHLLNTDTQGLEMKKLKKCKLRFP